MENNTDHRSYKTELDDRTLWYDGDSSFDSERLLSLLSKYDIRYVDRINDLVKAYNKNSSVKNELKVKDGIRPLSFEWNIPDEYKNIDLQDYLVKKLVESVQASRAGQHISDEEAKKRYYRIREELKMYRERGLYDVLRAIIYVINTLTDNNVVWGVGRGSSVSSYVLYLIGVHDVDSYAYELDIGDFLHD